MPLPSQPLKSLSNLPPTPGRQVKHLKTELEKKESENEALKSSVAELTKALESIKFVQDKAATSVITATNNEENKKKKKKRDEHAPTPAVTAYRFFVKDVGSENTSGEDMRRMWKECQGDARKKYVEMAAEDKQRFDKENEVYMRQVSEKEQEEKALELYYEKQKQELAMQFYEAHVQAQAVVKDDKQKKKKVKDPNAPKGSKSAYMFFCQEKREEFTKKNPGKGPAEVTKILGEEWNKLEKGKRGKKGTKKYDDLAAKDKIRYDSEKEVYEAQKEEEQQKMVEERETQLVKDKEEAMKLLKETEINIPTVEETETSAHDEKKQGKKKTKPSGPKKPSTAYIFFVAENREKVRQTLQEKATLQEIMGEVGRQWRMLSDEDKKPYTEKASKDKERYQQELEALK
uniref:HMG box domain-containing protein n=1 Tax=Trieres chinensis TaxID=1514140 RepID=A0A7S2EXH8_TRICV|mmetsp:Transcript_9080/g.19248  ORF Transcript_9080/g.19248 Transcript_9080/m.19248 type:complete len:403 (+) Transcript_9080:80-1288(+)|eukprot:CAMPEP_0183296432 /NCGR_PEP_ID=MMETSP0160_2-20130417/3985_1 /TAXON_ID=2839 ORGANISM="Odontella Sinensis, Strain Grunow 1884" /NCGR_SAMPLE_ID=MMETSP0160_2 /ASSEMBLY_ACC=CAM_ASM_000250 /LENGTH=402 /DNA_ID=CAMNT_0025458041 /DNA_START=80 /DNA_END=1288 /DNA_ORIENTATION=-